MARFVFRLQPVLDHRKRIEDQRQQAVALRRRAQEEAKRELERLNDEFRHYSGELRDRHRSLDVEELRLHYAHLQFLDRLINAQIHVLAERQAALDRARRELVLASKDRKIVDKLKQRRRQTFTAEEMRVEQIELEDANARMHARRGAGSAGLATGGTM